MAAPDYQPAWLTDELNKLLAQLKTRKQRQTILRLAEAAAIGRTELETFKLPGVCSRTTWYGKYRHGEKLPGWRDDPLIAEVLMGARERALAYQDQAEARRIARRQEQVAEARDLLSEYAPHAAKRLFVLMNAAGNEEIRRKAANDILDRADEATASKGVQHIGIKLDEVLDAMPTGFGEAIRTELAKALSENGD